jgi:hypothetical protein
VNFSHISKFEIFGCDSEEEWRGEEQRGEEEEEAELERLPRQTWRSHMVAPPITPAQEEDRVRIRPLGDR